MFAPGDMHRFWNAGDEELVCAGYVRPPDNLEYFLTQIYASTAANGGKRPRLFDGAYLATRYRAEFGMGNLRLPFSASCFRSWWPSAGSWACTGASPGLPSP